MVNFLSWVNESGIGLVRLFRYISRFWRLVRLEMVDGIGLVRLGMLLKKRIFRLESLVMISGIGLDSSVV